MPALAQGGGGQVGSDQPDLGDDHVATRPCAPCTRRTVHPAHLPRALDQGRPAQGRGPAAGDPHPRLAPPRGPHRRRLEPTLAVHGGPTDRHRPRPGQARPAGRGGGRAPARTRRPRHRVRTLRRTRGGHAGRPRATGPLSGRTDGGLLSRPVGGQGGRYSACPRARSSHERSTQCAPCASISPTMDSSPATAEPGQRHDGSVRWSISSTADSVERGRRRGTTSCRPHRAAPPAPRR